MKKQQQKHIYLVLSLILTLLCLINFSYAMFDHTDWGSRAVGVGFGIASYPQESLGIFWNPASIGSISGKEINTMYGMPFMGLSDINIKYILGNFVTNLAAGGAIGVGVGMFDVSDVWRESLYVIGYGREIDKFLVGAVVKYMEYKVLLSANEYGNDPLLEKGGKSTISADIGGIYKMSENFNVGVTIKDVLEPEIGIEETEKVKRGYLIAASYKIVSPNMEAIISAGNYMYGNNSDFSVGAEAWLSGGKIGVRGSYLPYRYAIGASYNLEKLRVDYTYVIPSQLTETSGSHYISVLLRL